MRYLIGALCALALVLGACSSPGAVTSPSPTLTDAPATAVPAGSSPATAPPAPFGVRVLGKATTFAAPCILDGAQIRSDILLWTDCDRSTPALTSRIIGYSLPSGPAKVLYEPKVPATGISVQQISDTWITWSENLDKFTAKDAKLYALPRSGGTPILIDDMTAHGTLAALSDMTLDGADIYWTLPLVENGVWHGRLMRQHLPDGPPTVAVQAPLGMIIGWPTVRSGMMAYELSSQKGAPQDHVMLRFPDGHTQQIGTAATSEPALGDGFVTYKLGERYNQADIAAYRIGDGSTFPLGHGEQPSVSGPYVTWLSMVPQDNIVRLARPLMGCIDKLSDKPINGISTPFVGAGTLSWVVRSDQDAQLFFAQITPSANSPCSP